MDKVGKEGVITVEDGKGLQNELEVSKACSSTAGISRRIHQQRGEADSVLEDPYILLHDKKISNIRELCDLGTGSQVRQTFSSSPKKSRRGARDAGGKQPARNSQDFCREGAGVPATAARPCSKTSPSLPAVR